MNTRMTASIVVALASVGAGAADYTDTAQVIAASPIIERVTEPRQECVTENAPVAQQQERSLTGPIVGGVAGAVLGSQVGRGSGRTAATAAGAVAGTIIGDRIGNPQTAAAQPVQRCRTVETIRDVVKGYTVVYRYNGRDITTTLPYHPGNMVHVGVGVIDERQQAAPAPSAMGSNVRDLNPPPPPNVAPVSAPPGGYPYRY